MEDHVKLYIYIDITFTLILCNLLDVQIAQVDVTCYMMAQVATCCAIIWQLSFLTAFPSGKISGFWRRLLEAASGGGFWRRKLFTIPTFVQRLAGEKKMLRPIFTVIAAIQRWMAKLRPGR